MPTVRLLTLGLKPSHPKVEFIVSVIRHSQRFADGQCTAIAFIVAVSP